MNKSLIHYLLITLLGIFLVNCKSGLTKLESVDLEMSLPKNHVQMNLKQFDSYFRNSSYSDSIVDSRLERMQGLNNLRQFVFLQDTTNIYNTILIMEPPYMNLNQKSFKTMKRELHKTLEKRFVDYDTEQLVSELKNGTYPYAKWKYKIYNCQESFFMTYYSLNKSNRTKMIVVNNTDSLDFEESIRTIE